MRNTQKPQWVTRLTFLITSACLALCLPIQAQQADEQQIIEEVVVVGTQIKGAQITEALPVTVLDEADLESIGVNSGDELLEHLAEQGNNFFSEAENISGGVNSARGDIGAFNLRNVGTGNTLVLLNGRRMVNAASYQTELVGGSFVPVNTVNAQSLPITGLRRVEVLKDGASAIYGADAVAGVVNYVLKDDFEGLRIRGRFDDYESIPRDDQRITVEWGRHFNEGRTRVGVFVNYFDRERVNSQDDPRWANSDFRSRLPENSPWRSVTSFRNNSANSRFGQYDILGSISGFNLGGVTDGSGEFETYPTGDSRCAYQITADICGAPDGQGTYRYNLNEDRDLVSELERLNVYAYFNHDFENGMESFTELTAYFSESNLTRHPSARLSAVEKHTVAADNFYNPFGPCGSANRLPDSLIPDVPCTGLTLELDNYRWTQVPRIVDNEGDVFRLVTGLRGSIEMSDAVWDWEGALTWSRATREDVTHNRISNELLQIGLNDTTASAINPWGAGDDSNISRALVDVKRENETDLLMFDLKLTNAELFELPTGPVGFVFGLEYREESFDDDRDPRLDGTITFTDRDGVTYPFISDVVNSSPTADSDGERDVTSAFVEFFVPIGDSIDVQLALRYEDFSDVGSTTVGKAAFGWQPIPQFMLRGSWSEAFRAPNLITINESQVARSNNLDDYVCLFVDPNENTFDCSYNIQRTAQGSRSLEPEESTNTNFGIVFEPLDRLTFTVDFWEIEKDDTIGLFGEENLIALELLNLINAGTANCGTTVGSPNVVRDPSDGVNDALYLAAGICPQGEAIRVNDRYANLDTRTIKGHDIGIYYNFDSPIGNFDLKFVGSYLDDYDQEASGAALDLVAAQAAGILPASVPVTGFADLVRQNGNIEEKLTARIRWRSGPWGASVTGLRYGDFVQTSLTLSDTTEYVVEDMMTINVSVDYRFDFTDDISSRVRFGINNIDDERAPLADRFFGYFADQHRDLGRYYYLDWQVHFK
ncbi:MAG: TonB-dependent receptor [Pseudomonadota bacterium]